jgi:hypothetical protein
MKLFYDKNLERERLYSDEKNISKDYSKFAAFDLYLTIFEGMDDVKQSKIDTLTHEYELFCMEQDENLASMQMKFTQILNKLKTI